MMMFKFFTRRRRRSNVELEIIQQERSHAVRRLLGTMGLIFLASVAFLGTMIVLPAWLELQSLRQQKASTERRLLKAQEEEEAAHSRYIWMMDPEYFEQIARDRANQAKDGETVVRRPTAADRPRPTPAQRDNPPQR